MQTVITFCSKGKQTFFFIFLEGGGGGRAVPLFVVSFFNSQY